MSEYNISKTRTYVKNDIEHEAYTCKSCGVIVRTWQPSANYTKFKGCSVNEKANFSFKIDKIINQNKLDLIKYIQELYNRHRIIDFYNYSKDKLKLKEVDIYKLKSIIEKLNKNLDLTDISGKTLSNYIYKSTIFVKKDCGINYEEYLIKEPKRFRFEQFMKLLYKKFHMTKMDKQIMKNLTTLNVIICPCCGLKVSVGDEKCWNCKTRVSR